MSLKKEIKLYKQYFKTLTPLSNECDKKSVYPPLDIIKEWGFDNPIMPAYTEETIISNKATTISQEVYKYCIDDIKINKSNVKLRVCSYNVHSWTNVCNIGGSYKKSFDNFKPVFEKIDADVLCLQEVVPLFETPLDTELTNYDDINKINFDYLKQEFEELGYKYCIIGNTMKSSFQRKKFKETYYYLANAIFSKIPFEQSEIILLPCNRNFIIAKIIINNTPIIIVNTHFEFINKNIPDLEKMNLKPQGPKYDLFNLQIDLLVLYIFKICNNYNTKNVIICGDLNKPYFEVDKEKYSRSFWRWRSINKNYKLFNKYFFDTNINDPEEITNFNSNIATDFIFTSKNVLNDFKIENHYVIKTDASDHYPVVCDFN
jgi:endonuclease/exonuclease/phosphatase family metal-dependent hydrolase